MKINTFSLSLCAILLTPANTFSAKADDGILDLLPAIINAATAIPGQITDAEGNRCVLSEDQSALLELHNTARASGRFCGNTFYPAVSSVTWNCSVAQTAVSHSAEMQSNGDLNHTGNNGSDAGDRLTTAGYGWTRWGENIAFGRTSASGTMDQWLESPSHCSSLMDPEYREIGTGQDTVSGRYWTVVFGNRFF